MDGVQLHQASATTTHAALETAVRLLAASLADVYDSVTCEEEMRDLVDERSFQCSVVEARTGKVVPMAFADVYERASGLLLWRRR